MINKLKFQIYWRYRELLERLNIVFGSEFILVYTMGKVGSTSLYYSLRKKIGSKVIFVHRMNRENIAIYNKPFIKNKVKSHRFELALFVKRKLIDKLKPISVITAVREPVSRNISDFFQDFRAYNDGKDFHEISVEDSVRNFVVNYPHFLPQRWFEMEFTAILKMNVKDICFDTNKKYAILEKDNLRLLIIRTDLENEIKNRVLQRFLSIDDLKIGVHNANQDKGYYANYNEFLEKVKLPEPMIMEIYSQEHVKYFFTKKEIDKFRKKWS